MVGGIKRLLQEQDSNPSPVRGGINASIVRESAELRSRQRPKHGRMRPPFGWLQGGKLMQPFECHLILRLQRQWRNEVAAPIHEINGRRMIHRVIAAL